MRIIVRKRAAIGANEIIICGNKIGQYAMIGAGEMITKPIKAYALVVGNPAKQVWWVSEYCERLNFEERGQAVCKATRENYFLKSGTVLKNFSIQNY